MKKQKIIFAAAIALFAATTLSSCKKDKKKEPTCNLISATLTGAGTPSSFTFSYNSDNKVNQIVNVNGATTTTTTLAYSGNTVNVIATISGKISSKTVLTLNSAGRVTRIETHELVKDTIQSYSDFTYNANGELTTFANKSGGTPLDVSTVATINGNISSIAGSGNISTLEYFTDQAWRAGDYIDLVQMISIGNNYYLFNKNLVKTYVSNGDVSNFTYTFDANNNISTLKIVGGGTTTDISYQHQCQ